MRNRFILPASILLFASSLAACSDGSNDPQCELEPCNTPGECAAGTFADAATDTCAPCPAGHWCAGGNAAPAAHTTCDSGEIEVTAPSATQDRVCEAVASCDPDQAPRVIDATVTGVAGAGDCCHLHVGDVSVEDNVGLPDYDEPCLVIQGNYSLTGSTADPSTLVRVEGMINVSDYDGTDLKALASLLHVTRHLSFNGLSAIENFNDLGALQVVGEITTFGNIPGIVNLEGLGALHTSGGLQFLAGLSLDDYTGLNSLTEIGGTLSFPPSSTTPGNFIGFKQIVKIEGDLSLTELPAVESLQGFDHLHTIGGTFIASNIGEATNLQGMPALTAIEGGISIVNNNHLTDLSGLDGVERTSGSLLIGSNPLLEDLDDILQINEIGTNVSIRGNARLCPSIAQSYIDDPMRSIGGNKLQSANGTEPGLVCP